MGQRHNVVYQRLLPLDYTICYSSGVKVLRAACVITELSSPRVSIFLPGHLSRERFTRAIVRADSPSEMQISDPADPRLTVKRRPSRFNLKHDGGFRYLRIILGLFFFKKLILRTGSLFLPFLLSLICLFLKFRKCSSSKKNRLSFSSYFLYIYIDNLFI